MTEIDIPARFWTVSYNGAQLPDADNDFARGANCQRFGYALLAEAGLRIPPFRSSELWADETYTWKPTTFEPLDLILFNRTADPWGAHVAVIIGNRRAIHLCKAEGVARIWSIGEFLSHDHYRVLIGVKRVRSSEKGLPKK
jgi:hypothetical protein